MSFGVFWKRGGGGRRRRRTGRKRSIGAVFFSFFLLFQFLARVNAAESASGSTRGPLACSRPRAGEKSAGSRQRERLKEKRDQRPGRRRRGLLCQSLFSLLSLLLALFLSFTPPRSASSSSAALADRSRKSSDETQNERKRQKRNERAPAFSFFAFAVESLSK